MKTISKENIKKHSIEELLNSLPSNEKESIINKFLKDNKKLLRKKSSLPRTKDTVKRNTWIPKFGDTDFEHMYLFVLRSIFENESLGITSETYKNSLKQARGQYIHFIHHHGISGGTKK